MQSMITMDLSAMEQIFGGEVHVINVSGKEVSTIIIALLKRGFHPDSTYDPSSDITTITYDDGKPASDKRRRR